MARVIKISSPATIPITDNIAFPITKMNTEIVVRQSDQRGVRLADIKGGKGKIPDKENDNIAIRAAVNMAKYIGIENLSITFEIRNTIPVAVGLGVTSALAAAGVYAITKYTKTNIHKREMLDVAIRSHNQIMMHKKNHQISASLLGGIVINIDTDPVMTKKTYLPDGLFVVVIVPDEYYIDRSNSHMCCNLNDKGYSNGLVASLFTSDLTVLGASLNSLSRQVNHIQDYDILKSIAYQEGALGFSSCGSLGHAMYALCDNSLIAEKIKSGIASHFGAKSMRAKIVLDKINQEGAFLY